MIEKIVDRIHGLIKNSQNICSEIEKEINRAQAERKKLIAEFNEKSEKIQEELQKILDKQN